MNIILAFSISFGIYLSRPQYFPVSALNSMEQMKNIEFSEADQFLTVAFNHVSEMRSLNPRAVELNCTKAFMSELNRVALNKLIEIIDKRFVFVHQKQNNHFFHTVYIDSSNIVAGLNIKKSDELRLIFTTDNESIKSDVRSFTVLLFANSDN